jgi:DNA-binding NarL/FixJ family response regulator
MGGQEALGKLLEIDPQVKAIVSSGYSNDPVIADFKKYGFQQAIVKPYQVGELHEVLKTLLRNPEH